MQPNIEELQKEVQKLQKELTRYKKQLKDKRYGLVWLDVPEAFEDESENQMPVLEEVKELAIKNDDGKPTHILIEGDNYHALTCLNYTHKGKIDLIYIDPPYNTGSDGFRYKDKRVLDKFPDGTDVPKNHPLRHSYWLSFMGKRLELAKNLLKKDGVILISIDNNELAQLKLLCDSVFGEENYVEIFNWEKTQSPSNLSHKSKERIEYVLCYEVSKNKNRFQGLSKENPNDNPLIKSNNSIKTLVFPKDKIYSTLKDDYIFKAGIYGTKVNKVKLLKDVEFLNGSFQNDIELESKFIWTQKNLEAEIEKNTKIIFKGKSLAPRYDKVEYKPEVPPNLIDERCGVGTNDNSKQELLELGIKDFEYPKPISLLSYLIQFLDKPNAIVLDFFSGTGTTGHSVLEINKKNSNRQFILCNSNENGICRKTTYARLKKAIYGYNGEVSNNYYEPLGNSLKYYKTTFVGKHNIKSVTDEDKAALAIKCGYLLAITENTMDEVEHTKFQQHFTNGQKNTAIYFQENLTEYQNFFSKVENGILPTTVYLFSWDTENEFENDYLHLQNVTVKSIPQPIVEIYKSIFNLDNNDIKDGI
jgi:adenine-specific DNA-methyltransferase